LKTRVDRPAGFLSGLVVFVSVRNLPVVIVQKHEPDGGTRMFTAFLVTVGSGSAYGKKAGRIFI